MKGRFSRTFLMIAGIVTVIIILLSQSYYQPLVKNSSTSKKEERKENKSGHHEHNVALAPDVVASPAIQLDKNTPSVLKIVAPEERSEISFLPESRFFVSFFKALLRATISPNAP
jgi:hypothetical protein